MKNSFKRVLAATLALTTAFTFAPLTGLQKASVVNAATASLDVHFAADSENVAHFLANDGVVGSAATLAGGDTLEELNNASSGATINRNDTPVLYVKSGEAAVFTVAANAAIASGASLNVLKAPDGISVTMGKIEAGGTTSVLTISATKKVKADINASPNVQLEIDGLVLKMYVSSDTFTQSISGKDSVDLSVADGAKSIASILSGAEVAGVNGAANTAIQAVKNTGAAAKAYGGDTNFSVDDALVAAADLKTAAGVADTTVSENTSWTDTLTAKASATGSAGKLTVANKKGAIKYNDTWNIEVEKATKAITVNVKNSVSAAATAIGIGTNVTNNYSIPFKALVSMSGDVTASEVNSDDEALQTETGKIKIDNDNKVITVVARATGSTKVKFVPKDATKNGSGTSITLNFDATAGTSATTPATSVVIVPDGTTASGAINVPAAAKSSTDDSATLLFENDAIGGLIKVTPTKNGSGVIQSFTVTANLGTPGGTYKAYLASNDGDDTNNADGTASFTFQEVNVVVSGASKDRQVDIGIAKINGNDNVSFSALAAARTTKANVAAGLQTDGTTAAAVGAAGNYTKDAYNSAIEVAGGTKTVGWTVGAGTYGEDALGSTVRAHYQDIVLLSGVDYELEITSPIAAAGLVSDLSLGSLNVEDPGTGARITDGFTADGMKIKVAADKMVAGKTYYLYVTTKGSGISESDAMTKSAGDYLSITVRQGYAVNYNYGDAQVKAGKTIQPVSLSTNETTVVKLEDGSNLDYAGATFLGWAYTEGATKADISATSAKNGLSAAEIKTAVDHQVNNVINLYAVYDFVPFTMEFDLNGGTGTSIAKKNFTVKSTDITLPGTAEGYAKGSAPLLGWTVTATGKNSAGATLTVYPAGTLTGAQLSQIVKENDPELKNTAIKMYAQYGSPLKSVAITPATLELTVGEATGKVSATATAEDGTTSTLATITYTSSDPSVATVAEDGTVTPLKAGTTNITATATVGSASVTSATPSVVTVAAAKKAATFKQSAKSFKLAAVKKAAKKVTITVKGSKGTIKATNKSASKIKKNLTIKVSGRKVVATLKKGAAKGTYKVKVVVAAKGNYKKTVKTFSIKVK